ncbi:MAG: diphthine--ammonia ligase [Fervidobacterium sp.]
MKVAVSWSGGKESGLAYYKAMNEGHEVSLIVTFLWETPMFHHSLRLIKLQSEAMKTPHTKVKVKQPYFEGYRKAVSNLREKYKIEGIVTGDISITDSYHGDWMQNVCEGLTVELIRPLWNLNRCYILKELVSKGFKAMFTCVKKPWFNDYWLGRVLDDTTIQELKELEEKFGMDPCGEFGEYHTMLIDAPMFKEVIEISKFEKEQRNSILLLKPIKFFLKPKNSSVQ